MVVKWSACSPATLTIQVQIPLTSTVFSVKFVFEKEENRQKEVGVDTFLKKFSEIFRWLKLSIKKFYFLPFCYLDVEWPSSALSLV